MQIASDLGEMFESGVSILVGTRSASFLPEAARGCGALVHPDRRRLTLFVPAAVAERTLANLADNGQIAVGFSNILDHKTMQVKGRAVETRDASENERDTIVRYQGAFIEVLAMIGLPRTRTRPWNVWPSKAITIEVDEIFHQTPGPGAGEPYRGGGVR